MKKVGLCSINEDFSRNYADTQKKNYIVFSEMAFDFIRENIASVKNPKHLRDIFIPTIKYIKNVPHDTLILDMEVLMHDTAVAELKKDYTLVYLRNAEPEQGIGQIMQEDYRVRLEKICDEVIA
jgi:hypothetical protein